MVTSLSRRDLPQSASAPLKVASDERIYAIGDIHGRYDLLIPLLRRIQDDAVRLADERRTRLVFLGDYVDRGPDSARVLAALSRLYEAASPDLVFLRGNHEAALLDFLVAPQEHGDWLEFGGMATVESFGLRVRRGLMGRIDLAALRDDLAEALAPHWRFLTGLLPVARSGDVLFSHAGLDPALPLERQPEEALIWGTPDFLTDHPLPGKRIVHGHFDDVAPVIRPGRLCIDTGAYYSGILSAVRLDAGDAILSVRKEGPG